MAAFRGMHVSPAKHSYAWLPYQESVTIGQTHTRKHRQTPDKVIPMCRYASQATQKVGQPWWKLNVRKSSVTDRLTDRRTECKPIVPSGFTGGGLIKGIMHTSPSVWAWPLCPWTSLILLSSLWPPNPLQNSREVMPISIFLFEHCAFDSSKVCKSYFKPKKSHRRSKFHIC